MTYEELLENTEIRLRALEPSDVDLLYAWENDTSIWDVSSTIIPFSKNTIRNYINNSQSDIYEAKQLRLMIEDKSSQSTIGAID